MQYAVKYNCLSKNRRQINYVLFKVHPGFLVTKRAESENPELKRTLKFPCPLHK